MFIIEESDTLFEFFFVGFAKHINKINIVN